MSEKPTPAPVSASTIAARFPHLFLEVIGDGNRLVHEVASPDLAKSISAVFLSTAKALTAGLQSPAGVLVVGRKNRDETLKTAGEKTILISSNVELAMAQTINAFFLASPFTGSTIQGIHKAATVHSTAVLGERLRVGPSAFIGARVRLGNDVFIGASAVIEDDSEIGDGTVIHPQVYIGHSTSIGQRCEIHPFTAIGKEGFGYAHDEKGNHYKIPHQGRVVIEDDVHIGSACAVDRATFNETRIRSGTKMDNTIHIAHNCTIGRNSLITAGFIVAGSTKIGANFVTGGNTGVLGHLEIVDNVQLGGMSGVTKSISEAGAYSGYPLQPLQSFLKTKAATVQLPKMRKQISRMMKHLGLSDEPESES